MAYSMSGSKRAADEVYPYLPPNSYVMTDDGKRLRAAPDPLLSGVPAEISELILSGDADNMKLAVEMPDGSLLLQVNTITATVTAAGVVMQGSDVAAQDITGSTLSLTGSAANEKLMVKTPSGVSLFQVNTGTSEVTAGGVLLTDEDVHAEYVYARGGGGIFPYCFSSFPGVSWGVDNSGNQAWNVTGVVGSALVLERYGLLQVRGGARIYGSGAGDPKLKMGGGNTDGLYSLGYGDWGLARNALPYLELRGGGIYIGIETYSAYPFMGTLGSLSRPTYSFDTAYTTGMFYSGLSTLGFSSNGVLGAAIDGGGIKVPYGSAAAPAYNFGFADATGWYRLVDNVKLSINGSVAADFNADGGKFPNGAVATPSISFFNSANTGFSLVGSGTINVSSAGALAARFTSAGARFMDGTSSVPSVCFLNDSTTGFYHPAIGYVGIASSGNPVMTASANGIQMVTGSTTTPALSFFGDSTTGISRNGAGQTAFISGGVLAASVGSGGIKLPFGTAAAPSLAWNGAGTTGIWGAATEIDFSISGVNKLSLKASTIDAAVLWNSYAQGTNKFQGADAAGFQYALEIKSNRVSAGDVDMTGISFTNGLAVTAGILFDGGGSLRVSAPNLFPAAHHTTNLGKPTLAWKSLYVQTEPHTTSDRKAKCDIADLENATAIVCGLRPRSYKLVDGDSGRTHFGLVAQEVEEMLTEKKVSTKDFAVICKDVSDSGDVNYSLRYGELIPWLIRMAQEQEERIKVLEAELNKRILPYIYLVPDLRFQEQAVERGAFGWVCGVLRS